MARFSNFDEDALQQLLDNKDSECTKKTVKIAICVLEHYLRAKGKTLMEIESGSTENCDDLLRKFYAEVRKEDGQKYAKKSLVTIRYGIQKHFLRTRNEDIINDANYKKSNAMFKAALVQLKKDGIGECISKEPVTPEDMTSLYSGPAFAINNAYGLQRKVMFEYLYFFCNRGRENLRDIKKGDFTLGMDATGREFVSVTPKQTKNHRGDNMHDTENKQGRMYDKPGNPMCPVLSFKKYVGKLHPGNPNFWQRPKKSNQENDDVWYDNMPLGKNTLFSFMQKLSEEFKLSKRYTNHCVRATSITILDHNNIEARHIMGVSGHKSENSIKSYSANISENKKRQMSDILSEIIPFKNTKMETVSKSEVHSGTASAYTSACVTDVSLCKPLPCVTDSSCAFPDLLDDDINFEKIMAEVSEYELLKTNSPVSSSSGSNSGNFSLTNCQVTFNISYK